MPRIRSVSLIALLALNACGDSEEEAAAPSATQVAVGTRHTCALKPDGTVRCWGFNLDGQADPPGGRFVQLTAGVDTSCGIRDDGTLSCWGNPFRERTEAVIQPPAGTFIEVEFGLQSRLRAP